jgi:hypothetical protein
VIPRRQLAILGLFLVAGFLAFSNILNSYFLSDDFVQIGKVLHGDLSVVWGKAHGGFFRPLFILSYLIDSTIWGARPIGFHLTNVFFHSLNAFLTFRLALRFVESLNLTAGTKRNISLGAGALFLLHPTHTEAVSWISGRADIFATCFCLASLLFFFSYARDKRSGRLVLSLLCFSLALLAKESAVCLPLLIVVVGLFIMPARNKGKQIRPLLAVFGCYFAILLMFVAVRFAFIGSLVGGYGASQHLNFSPGWLRDRLLEAMVRSVLPALPSQLSWFLFKPLQSRAFLLFALALVLLVAVAIVVRRRQYQASDLKEQNKFLITLVISFLFSLLPVINLRLTLYQTQGERFLYLPTVFSCLLMAYAIAILFRKQSFWIPLLICMLGFYAVRLHQTNGIWVEAALLSRSITTELTESSTRDHLIILNAPDNLRGVPVFHNGLPEALDYFQNRKRFQQIEIVALQELDGTADGATATTQAGSLTLRLENERDHFDRVEPSTCIEIAAERTKTSVELRPLSCAADSDLFLFDQGRMIRLPGR